MKNIRPTVAKKQSELNREWDRLASERHRQIIAGEDLSFDHVLVPTIFRLLNHADTSLVLDVGSGTGDLAARFAQIASRIVGVEPSHVSVELAQATFGTLDNLSFIESSLEEAADALNGLPVTAAMACMTLMTTRDVRGFAKALAALLPTKAKFAAVLCHPCFWPRYWGYETEPWFNYPNETFIEAPFAISRHKTEIVTTHVHRPLEHYLTVFADAGFQLETLVEPVPAPEIEALYPHKWLFPRFVGLQWERIVSPNTD